MTPCNVERRANRHSLAVEAAAIEWVIHSLTAAVYNTCRDCYKPERASFNGQFVEISERLPPAVCHRRAVRD